jgi:UDP-2,3-diacylglucosamine hydrolase
MDYNFAAPVVTALKYLHSKNVPLYFMPGNRDFLIGQEFCKATGMQLLPDPYEINLYGKPCLLTHGDLLCTQDLKYQRFRKFAQNSFIKKLFLIIPKMLRVKLGHWVRRKAMSRVIVAPQISQNAMYDADPNTVQQWLDKYTVDAIIHGHTHQPALYSLGTKQRIVLGDWTHHAAFILKAEPGALQLVDLVHKKNL